MIELKFEIIQDKLIRHWAEDAQGNKYCIQQVETGIIYEEAIDVLPCRYTYVVTDKPIEILPDVFNGI